MSDPVLIHDWHPVAHVHDLATGAVLAVRLLDEELVIWRGLDGQVMAWDDRCPHRGARLSLGRVVDGCIECPYHGWRFDDAGRCVRRPAQPSAPLPATPMTRAFAATERHGLIWVCLGTPARDVLPYPEFHDHRLRNVFAGPYDVQACGPRVIENFIDMAHFAFVHDGILGDAHHCEIPPYEVQPFVDDTGRSGVRATGMTVSQPQANLQASGAADVRYSYRISRPLSAVLTKEVLGSDVPEALALIVQPITEVDSRVWVIFSAMKSEHTDDSVRAFQDTVFMQDKPILESQRPKRLPLDIRLESGQQADLLSAHYRRLLREWGLSYGVI